MIILGIALAAILTDSSATCRANLDHMKEKIEANYAGYVLEVKNKREAPYAAEIARLRARADTTASADCFPVLKALTTWFNDPHLFVYQSQRVDTATARLRAAQVVHTSFDEASARRYLDSTHALDPIEGIWYDGPTRFAVMRDGPHATGFFAVLLNADAGTWHAGDIRARFEKAGADRYDATIWLRNFAMRHLDATLHKRTLLRLAPGMWGKLYPVLPADTGLLDPIDVHRPTLKVRGRTVIVSMPSHDPGIRPVLDSLVAAHAGELRSAERLIIDLRGNEGGSAGTSNALIPYVMSANMPPDPLDFRRALMLSSPDQIGYTRVAFGSDTSAFVRGLIARLEASPGEFVPVLDPAKPPDPDEPDSIIMGPARVGLMIDGGSVSAAEVIVMEAHRSSRVTIYGQNTEGALDYESTNTVAITPGERRWYLGYPTITANGELPAGGMRGKGIAPDVRIDWTRIADPVREVERRLGTH